MCLFDSIDTVSDVSLIDNGLIFYFNVAPWPPDPRAARTHRNHHAVLPLELGNVLVPPGHLRAVQRPEAAHHLDAGLRRVRHLRSAAASAAAAVGGWMERSVPPVEQTL